MQRKLGSMLFLFAAAAAAAAATVNFDQIVKTGDTPPGREGTGTVFKGRAFQTYNPGVFSRPAINETGDVVFRGVSSNPTDFNVDRATGLYLKRPGYPLAVIVDTTFDTVGNPKYAVPGQSAGTYFGDFKAPLINNNGDILFHANYTGPGGSGQGFYATTVSGGPIVKIVDSSTEVPGWPGTLFTGLQTSVSLVNASFNDNGEVVFLSLFHVAGHTFDDTGIFGSTVSGGPIIRLADSTNTMAAGGEGTKKFLNISQGNQPAINNSGVVLFQGGIGTSAAYPLYGLFTISVDGSALSTTVVRQNAALSPIMSDGVARAYFDLFQGHDINDNGDFVFQHTFQSGSPSTQALFGGNLNTHTLGTIVDNLAGGYAVPGTPGARFYNLAMATTNEHGQMGFFGNNDIASGQGIFAADLAKTSLALIANNTTPIPGQLSPAYFQDFEFNCAEVNEQGNMVLAPKARNSANTDSLFGLYFWDNCTRTLERLVDSDTVPDPLPNGLNDTFAASGCNNNDCVRGIYIHQGSETRSGHYHAMNNSNEIAFMTAFDTYTVGIYVAHVTAGAGEVSITCPPTATIECSGLLTPEDISPAITGQPTVTGCGDISVDFEDADLVPVCGNTGTIERTWTADGGDGSPATCTQTIVVVDTTPPALTLPSDISIQCGADSSPTATGTATAVDACDSAPTISYVDDPAPGVCGGNTVITRTWTVTDACGNETHGNQIITITDSTPPVLTPPSSLAVACGDSTAPDVTGVANATDSCDQLPEIDYTDDELPGACPGTSVITRTWTATDACGNVATAEQVITVTDTTAPTLTVPSAANVECDGDTTPDATGWATASDVCDLNPAITFADDTAPGACAGASTITRTWTATDACGNVVSATQTITVADTVAPALSIPANTTVGCDEDSSTAATGTATATDACDAAPTVTYQDLVVAGDCAGASTVNRTWTATDACGNAVSDTQVITIVDTTAPTLAVPADVVQSCDIAATPANTGQATATDNCAAPTVTYSDATTPGGCSGESIITRTWTAADGCGNAVSADQLITLADDAAPTLAVPADVILNCDDDTTPAGTGYATATDNCDVAPVVTYADTTAPGGSGESIITRTWTAADACGNAVSDVQTITVSDVTAPVLTVPADVMLECGDDTSPTVTGYAAATDNCDPNPIVAWSDATTAGSCASEVVITRTWTATDAYGNAAEDVQTITLADNEAPVLTLDTTPIYVTDVNCDGVEYVTLPTAVATDNCPGPVTITNDAPASFLPGETTPVTFTATDGCGNTSTQTVDVTVGYGSAIRVTAKKYTVGVGCRPWVQCRPLDNIPITAFSFNCGSCARDVYLHHWLCMSFALPEIYEHCEPVATGVTNHCGVALLDVPPGDYLVASNFDDNGDGIPETYLGVLTFNVRCGETRCEYLYMIQVANNRRMGCNWHYFFGSELIVIEPQEVVWDETEQLYPFVFDSEGDWDVNVSVAPPEGFVADYDELADTVDSELKALQFTITEVGSDLVPTISHFEIKHKDRTHIFDSSIDIKLTPDYAKSRGFNVESLRQRGLIVDKLPEAAAHPQEARPASEQPANAKPRRK